MKRRRGIGFQSLSILRKVYTQPRAEWQSLRRERTAFRQRVEHHRGYWSPRWVRRVSAWGKPSMEGQSPSK